MNKVKKIVILLCLIFMIINISTVCNAGYDFYESNYNYINIIKFLIILIYVIAGILLFRKQKRYKEIIWIMITTLLLIQLVIHIFDSLVINMSKEELRICIHYAVYFIMMISSLILGKLKLKVKKEDELKKLVKQTQKISFVILLLNIIIIIFIKTPKMYIKEAESSFGRKYNTRIYSETLKEGEYIKIKVLKEGEEDFKLIKVLEIDIDGVIIEYTRGYYEKEDKTNVESDSRMSNFFVNYQYKEEIVQQKIKWNKYYTYSPEEDPSLSVDGEIYNIIKFTK